MKIFKLLFKILICLIIFAFLCFQYFGYSSNYLDLQSSQEIKEKFHLKLTEENWRIEEYTKNTYINAKPTYYHITNSFLKFDDYHVSIQVTEGDEIFQPIVIPKLLSKNKRDQVMIEKQISHNNVDMTVQVIETEPEDIVIEYSAHYRIIISDNDSLYYFNFDKSPSISYSIHSTDIHEDEIDECLNIIDEVLLYK